MESLKVKIINNSGYPLPSYETHGAAGMDVRAAIQHPIVLHSLDRVLIPTGLRVQLPQGYEMQIRPRSGLAMKHGISIVNTPGTVDADYRGEIKVVVINLSKEPFVINPGERICQMVVTTYTHVKWEPVKEIDHTERGDEGFGHTGVK